MRLNKYLAHAGVASRRQSDALIQKATTFVNGKLIIDPAHPVTEKDDIVFEGMKLSISRNFQVILFHKPTKVVTTTFDPQGRRTILDYVKTKDRIFPIGRLDRMTTGLLLLTNDGELSNKLLHPKFRIPRIYEAEIDNVLDSKTIHKIAKGIFIGKGEFGRAEVLKQKKVKKRSTVHLKLFTGKKREIRRIFSFLNIRLFSLKRIQYGPIFLGELPCGEWRNLNNAEMNQLKTFNRSK